VVPEKQGLKHLPGLGRLRIKTAKLSELNREQR